MAKAKTAIRPRVNPARKASLKSKLVPTLPPRSESTRLERLAAAIEEVRSGARMSLRTSKLLGSGVPKMAQKVIEEAAEVAIEGIRGDRRALVAESVDLFYNLVVLLSSCGVSLDDVWAEMDRREAALGMAEKLPKAPSDSD